MFQALSTSSPRIYKAITYDVCLSTLVSVQVRLGKCGAASGAALPDGARRPCVKRPARASPAPPQTFPLLTVLINLNNGSPNAIAWDDGCYFCASNGVNCQPYALLTSTWQPAAASTGVVSCYTDTASCYSTTATPAASASPSVGPSPSPAANATVVAVSSTCDLQLFVAWSGTDSGGNYLTSQGKRFSRFRLFGTAALQQSAINIGTAGLNAVTGAVNPDTLIPGVN